MKQRILFVCLGNICRSPAAEEILRRMASEDPGLELTVDSAGTYAGHAGELPDSRMREAAHRRGYVLTHRSRPLRADDFDRFDRIVVMDDSVYERVHRLAPDPLAAKKIYRLVEFNTCDMGYDYVPDPYYEGQSGFEVVMNLLEDGCRGLIRDLKGEPVRAERR